MSLSVQDILDLVRDHEAVRYVDWSNVDVRTGNHRFEDVSLVLGPTWAILEFDPVPAGVGDDE